VNALLHVEEYIEKIRLEKGDKEAELTAESLYFFNKYPVITRRLASIYESNHGDLSYEANPWYDKMEEIEISAKHIAIIAKFIEFDNALRVKERDEYMLANGYEL
jgi:hypothetical protein